MENEKIILMMSEKENPWKYIVGNIGYTIFGTWEGMYQFL